MEVNALWSAWKTWCENEGRKPGTKACLGRDLRAAAPGMKKTRPLEGGSRPYVYEGIALHAPSGTIDSS